MTVPGTVLMASRSVILMQCVFLWLIAWITLVPGTNGDQAFATVVALEFSGCGLAVEWALETVVAGRLIDGVFFVE